jgi:uncharacterized protein (UPF0276 family)
MKSNQQLEHAAGIGLRLPHIAEVVATRPDTGFLEIHPENFLANPHATELLIELCNDYPISVHTVGISIGSATGIDRLHLKRIRTFIEKIQPVLVSGHLAWSSYGSDYLNDLLPLPLDAESLKIAADHISEVEDCWGRPYLIENPASYVGFCASTIGEPDFLSELVRRTGCKLLCDVSNAYVSAHNMGTNAYEYIDSLPGDAIAEFHLGGYTSEGDVLIDTHAAAIADPAWDLYAYAIRRFGPKPTLIEWDNDIPPLSALLEEAAHAKMISSGNPEERHAATG